MASPVRAKKHLGQHFLCDDGIARRIADALVIDDPEVSVIEIGPGTGVLTKFLLPRFTKFRALDVDAESVDYLKMHYPEHSDKFLLSDFLETDIKALAGERFCVIGNFPYNISSQIMFRILEYRNETSVVVGMFQKEVAQRIAEKPGTKTYGILSVLLQAYFDIEYLFTVHQNVFSPPPKVKSAVIRLKRNNVKSLECDESLFFRVVKTTFNQRRKQIVNSLRPLAEVRPDEHVLLTKRPEQLSVKEFVELTNFASNRLK